MLQFTQNELSNSLVNELYQIDLLLFNYELKYLVWTKINLETDYQTYWRTKIDLSQNRIAYFNAIYKLDGTKPDLDDDTLEHLIKMKPIDSVITISNFLHAIRVWSSKID